jgi:hypothetical protein
MDLTAEEIALLNLPPEDVLALEAADELMRAAQPKRDYAAGNVVWIPDDDSDMEEDECGSTWI